jgi:UDP-glucose 4-epimerase
VSKALITGGAGFVGLHLARHLVARGIEADLVDDFSRAERDRDFSAVTALEGTRVIERDLTHPDSASEFATDYRWIVHLAAIVGVSRVAEQPYRVLTDNAAMLDHVLTAARRQTALERFVFLSTSEVYAGTLRYFTLPLPTPETTPLAVSDLAQARTSYMLSKIYGEAMCHQAGIPFTILRPHNLYGPRMGFAHVIPELLQRAHEAPDGGTLEVYSADHRRTFCYIDDAIELIWRGLQSPSCAGRALNIGTQSPEVSMGELAELVAQVVEKTLEVTPLAPTPGSPQRRCPDMTQTTALTGYEAQIGLEEGICRTYAWYRSGALEARARARAPAAISPGA